MRDVLHEDDQAVFTAQPRGQQACGKSFGMIAQLAIGQATKIAPYGRFAGTSSVDGEQVLGEIKALAHFGAVTQRLRYQCGVGGVS